MFSLMKRKAAEPNLFEPGALSLFRREMDDLIENLFGNRGGLLAQAAVPRLDVAETDAAIEVTTDLPGYSKDEIAIDIGDNTLTIRGQHSEEEKQENNGKRFLQMERRSGSFSRTVWLPCAVDEDKIDAQLKDGVLTIKLPKSADAKRKKITVNG